jgi:UDP-glucose 4-epimerase
MRHALITGGAGFIGSHLAERLAADGHAVTVLDDFSTGRAGNLANLAGRPGFQVVRASVEDAHTVNTLMARCDAVYHLASAVGVQLVLDEPVRTIRTTIHGTEVVLEAANRFGRPVLVTSSSEVYGKGARVPFREDDDVVMGPTLTTRYCYAYCKGIDEFLGLAYHKQFGLPVTIVRLFNTVGPRQVGRYGMVLPRFVQAALANEPLKVFGDGNQTRCFSHVADVVGAIVKLTTNPATGDTSGGGGPAHAGRVFNLGGDVEVSMNDLARRVIALAGSTSRVEHQSYHEAYGQQFEDMPRRVPDLSRIREAIGFNPGFSLDQIIQSVLSAHRTNNC